MTKRTLRLLATNVKIGYLLKQKYNKTIEDYILKRIIELKEFKSNFISNNTYFDGNIINKKGERAIREVI